MVRASGSRGKGGGAAWAGRPERGVVEYRNRQGLRRRPFTFDLEACSAAKIEGQTLVFLWGTLQRSLGQPTAAGRLEDRPPASHSYPDGALDSGLGRGVVAAFGGAVALADAAAEVLGPGIRRSRAGHACGCRQLNRRDQKAEACVKNGSQLHVLRLESERPLFPVPFPVILRHTEPRTKEFRRSVSARNVPERSRLT